VSARPAQSPARAMPRDNREWPGMDLTATLFALCPHCRSLWLGIQADTLIHHCAALDPWRSKDPGIRDPDVTERVRVRRMRVEVPVEYASRVVGSVRP
jgi:hypothetical protein